MALDKNTIKVSSSIIKLVGIFESSPEEYQEYHQYVMDILRIRIWMISPVLGSICLVIASYVWIGIAWCIVLFIMIGVGLVIVFKKLKHKFYITKLTMALI